MSKRRERILQKRFIVFCEGDTEYNYIDKMRKKQGVELVLKPINMGGGGYANFLRVIKKEPQSNCLAKFIIVDADKLIKEPGEVPKFKELLNYCIQQNQKGNVPHFLIVNNPDFEYVACLHSSEYRNQEIHKFLLDTFGYKDIWALKSNENIYELLNKDRLSYQILLDAVRGKAKLIHNEYDIKKRTFEITIKKTIYDADMSSKRGSNIEEFFDVIDW